MKITLTGFVFLESNDQTTLLLWFKLIILFDCFEIIRIMKTIIYFREKLKNPKKGLKEFLKFLEKYSKNDYFFGNIFREANFSLKWTSRINDINKMYGFLLFYLFL